GIAAIARPENLVQAVADEQIILRRAVQLTAVAVEHRALDEADSLEPAVISDAIGDLDRAGVARIETHDDVLLAVRGNDLRGAVIDRVDADEMPTESWRIEIAAMLPIVHRKIILHDPGDANHHRHVERRREPLVFYRGRIIIRRNDIERHSRGRR